MNVLILNKYNTIRDNVNISVITLIYELYSNLHNKKLPIREGSLKVSTNYKILKYWKLLVFQTNRNI